jgi:hypothetical protein
MVIFGKQFNLVSVVISTFIFGIGVDYSIFVMSGLLDKGNNPDLLKYHKTAIFFSAVILIITVGSMMFARHPAISSVGFSPDTEGNGKLTVHLTYHVLGAHILRKEIDPFPYEDFPLTVDTVPLDKASEYGFGRSSFTAPRVDGYTLLVGQEPRTVYPVILPAGAKIDYIEVKDKTGKLQRVKPARGEALTGLEGGWKHPLTIRMEGIVPTVYPHEIIDWNEQHVGEVDKLPGIHSEEQFAAWLKVYNRNVDKWEAMNVADSVELAHYGVHNDGETPGIEGWTFYLWNDIDCKDMKPDASGALIKALPEGVTFDGKGYVLHNLMLDFEHIGPSSGTGIRHKQKNVCNRSKYIGQQHPPQICIDSVLWDEKQNHADPDHACQQCDK